VTGVLPVALDDATKAIGAFLHSGKEYVCLMQLHEDLPSERTLAALNEFQGTIYQKPPLRASVKREPRKRTIYEIEPIESDGRRILFRVACQAGTYVRKLCSDIGEVLRCGAHMRELRRSRAGPFTEDQSRTMHELVEAKARLAEGDEGKIREIVRPIEQAFEYIPKIYIRDSAVDAICHGAELAVPGIVKLDSNIRSRDPIVLFTLKGELVALARAEMASEQMVESERGIAAKTVRVLMPRGTYPALWREQVAHHPARA
jgi:H/ACA ribonucleoprotein complex subunit 4